MDTWDDSDSSESDDDSSNKKKTNLCLMTNEIEVAMDDVIFHDLIVHYSARIIVISSKECVISNQSMTQEESSTEDVNESANGAVPSGAGSSAIDMNESAESVNGAVHSAAGSSAMEE